MSDVICLNQSQFDLQPIKLLLKFKFLFQSVVARQFLLCLFFLIAVLLYCQYEENHEEAIKHMGLICCFVTLLFFAAPLASLFHVFAVRNTDSLPFPIILTTFAVCLQWYFYGMLIGDKFIQVCIYLAK